MNELSALSKADYCKY